LISLLAGKLDGVARTLRVLEILACSKGKSLTKRDIYYMDTGLFQKQYHVDSIVSRLAAAYEIPRDELGVVASPRGLAYGHLQVGQMSFKSGTGLAAIPKGKGDIEPPDLVLIVEKEAVFNSIVHIYSELSRLFPRLLIVTGRGYPDLNTSKFIHWLCELGCKVTVLCDFDPYGMDIALRYRQGSKLPADRASSCCEKLMYLGISRRQIDSFSEGRDCNRHAMSTRDQKRLDRVIKSARDTAWDQLRLVAEEMKVAGFGTEIESIYGTDHGKLQRFLENELRKVIKTSSC